MKSSVHAPLDLAAIRPLLEMSIREDLGEGDVTSRVLISEGSHASGVYVAQQDLILAGLPVAAEVVRLYDSGLTFRPACSDGDRVPAGTIFAEIRGRARSVRGWSRHLACVRVGP